MDVFISNPALMAWKIDIVLLQSVKWLWNKNDVVSVSVAYAKNVLFPSWQAKMADAITKNNLAQKKDQQNKHNLQVSQLWDEIQLYVAANERLIINRKTTPTGKLYEKVHETDVRDAFKQRDISLPTEIQIQKNMRDALGEQHAKMSYGNKKQELPFIIKETY